MHFYSANKQNTTQTNCYLLKLEMLIGESCTKERPLGGGVVVCGERESRCIFVKCYTKFFKVKMFYKGFYGQRKTFSNFTIKQTW